MIMSTTLVGLRQKDAEWEKMKQIFDLCIEMEVQIPLQVEKYFNFKHPDENEIEVPLGNACSSWKDEKSIGFIVDLRNLSPGITKIKFYNTY